MTGRRGLVALGLVLLAVLAAVGVQLHRAQGERQRGAERRFAQRAEISSALTQSVFRALSSARAKDLAREYGGPASELGPRLAMHTMQEQLGYMAVVDGRGRRIATGGTAQPPRGANRLGSRLADVRRTAAGPLVDVGFPFVSRSGDKRVLVEGIPVALMAAFIEDYLRRLPNPDGARLIVTDTRGTVLARVAPSDAAKPAPEQLTARANIPGTTWHLRLQADRSRVLAENGGGAWLGWALLGGLAAAILTGLLLCARVIGSARRTRATNLALRESEGKLRGLVGALEEAVCLYHADGSIELLNASAKTLLETDADVIAEPNADWLLVNDDGEPLGGADGPVGRSFATGLPQRRVIGLDRPNHVRAWLDVSTRPLTRAGEKSPYAVVSTCTDVTERQNLEAHLLDLVDRDPLTGLWNRRRFEQSLAHQLDRCRRYDERAALVLMDVDGFKQVNDVLGHLAGDEVLCALGNALSTRLRASDVAARLGGDEFAVLLLDADDERAAHIASELTAHMCDAAAAAQSSVDLSISAGSAVLDRSTGGLHAALESADRAMYSAKQRRNGEPGSSMSHRPAIVATAQMSSLRALLAAVNARDSYTASHSREVVTLARAVARPLGLDAAQTSEVEHIALLHDLGKIAVPDAILRKAGPLTSNEQTLMRQHPVVGAEILASMPELAHLAPAVRAEHERWDGGGYPDGLVGEQIPMASRVTFVCDAFHAMTSNRPYRRAMTAAAAREEIRREAGAQFCPRAAAALLEVQDERLLAGSMP